MKLEPIVIVHEWYCRETKTNKMQNDGDGCLMKWSDASQANVGKGVRCGTANADGLGRGIAVWWRKGETSQEEYADAAASNRERE